MEGKQNNTHSIILAAFAFFQVVLVAAFAAGWHPWEQRLGPKAAETVVNATSSNDRSLAFADIRVPFKDSKSDVFTSQECLNAMKASLGLYHALDIEISDDDGHASGRVGDQGVYLVCLSQQNIVTGVVASSNAIENIRLAGILEKDLVRRLPEN